MALNYKIISVNEMTESLKKRLFFLFRQYYSSVSYESFKNDLSSKSKMILLIDYEKLKNSDENYIFGFSSVEIGKLNNESLFIFSGDTVIDQRYWGTKLLQKAFSTLLLKTRVMNPAKKLYWMLMSKGYKTYLLMRNNFPISFPQFKHSMNPELKKYYEKFYQDRFFDYFSAETNLINFGESRGEVKNNLAKPDEHSLLNKDIEFFVMKNNQYDKGVELACMAEIRWIDILGRVKKYIIPSGKSKSGYLPNPKHAKI